MIDPTVYFAVICAIGIALISGIGSMVTAIFAWKALKRIHDIHVSINSRMDELIVLTAEVARAEGKRDAELEDNKVLEKSR